MLFDPLSMIEVVPAYSEPPIRKRKNVISGISGTADDVIEAYLQSNLLNSKFFMPGHRHYSNTLRTENFLLP